MPHRRESDEPGDWFHVINRAVARRSMFENRADIDVFLGRIGETVERGWLEVHSFSVLTTHFHALVRSPIGELARAMHRVQLGYVRYFNRTRRRDGPLLRGRYVAKKVRSLAYRRSVVGYIDDNPRRAGLTREVEDYPFGSCRAYVLGGGPEWLCREWVLAEVRAGAGRDRVDGVDYLRTFVRGFTAAHRELVERRIATRSRGPDAIDSLLEGSSPAVRDWLVQKAALADGTRPGLPVVPPQTVLDVVARAGASPMTLALLLRDLAGATFEEIAERTGGSAPTALRLCRRGRARLVADASYARRVAELGHRALVTLHG